ncbi:hypothetical protein AAFF_G00050190 [Aldrovandia affinis]|uniref:Immunoglobulin domain-containing protein n=1 Tax=Aldrovandia affinis TaxID=143900 RepID=A0AAD7R1S3_9TELE|nr:hypothetical protein AAFF_G00050190 [Aldrovandia affinis]
MNNQNERLKRPRLVSAVNMLLHILVCQCGGTEGITVAAAGSTTNVTVGQSVLFPVSPEGNQSVIIELTFKSIIVVSWFSKYKKHEFHSLYEHRIDIQEGGSIRMNNVQLSDSGLYHIKTHDMSVLKPTKYSGFHLQVFERVSKPNITAECRRNNISLSCSSIRGNEVTYSWETLPPDGNDSCLHLGQTMEIYPLPPSESTTYTCTAKNPVSRATSDPIDLGVCSIQQPRVQRSSIRRLPCCPAKQAELTSLKLGSESSFQGRQLQTREYRVPPM